MSYINRQEKIKGTEQKIKVGKIIKKFILFKLKIQKKFIVKNPIAKLYEWNDRNRTLNALYFLNNYFIIDWQNYNIKSN